MSIKDFPVIERINEKEIHAIKELEIECGLSPWTLNDYYEEIKRPDSVSFAAKSNTYIIGFIIARLIMTNIPDSFDIEIYNICISKEYRRNGIGERLIRSILAVPHAHIDNVWLEVRKSNATAQAFYKKMNFEIEGTRKGFFSNPLEDGYIMRLRLHNEDRNFDDSITS